MKNCLETADLEGTGQIMSDNHKILIDMGLSHEKLVYLCNVAISEGTGGYMVALTPNKSL